jgi:hypothetical protein
MVMAVLVVWPVTAASVVRARPVRLVRAPALRVLTVRPVVSAAMVVRAVPVVSAARRVPRVVRPGAWAPRVLTVTAVSVA